ncbi:MAG: AAA family ATPase [Chloroflexi bacterium]|nr:AAA family ATPase [Chloroflexota bacterium]
MANNIPRYPPTYRQNELHLIIDAARQGQSLCLMGVAGIGKSNITNFLRYEPEQCTHQYLGDEPRKFLFPVVAGNAWDQKPQGLWEAMLAELAAITQDLPAPPPTDPKILQLSEEQRSFSLLRERLQWLVKDYQIMFILDDFDKVLQNGPLSMLEQLSTLRNAGNRDKLSYLIFTKKLPAVLGRAHPLQNNSKFYDLFKDHVYALEPYNREDAQQMLTFLNENAGRPLGTQDLILIREKLSGGHASLARIIFDSWLRARPDQEDLVAFFAKKPEVRNECQRIFQGLHREEQQVAQRLVRHQQRAEDQGIIDQLVRRGLLINQTTDEWVSPLLVEFLRSYTAEGGQSHG